MAEMSLYKTNENNIDFFHFCSNRMKKIDLNLERVKKNLEYMEDMYEGVFRRVNRLIVK
jgi:hypothetical protein